MNIVVCVKQVPYSTEVKINPETRTLERGGVESVVNPFDMYALEQALKIRDMKKGKVTVLTMGPPQATKALKTCVELGADEAIHLSDRAFAGSDTWATGWILANAIHKISCEEKVDLVCCGKQATDGDTAQVAGGISEYLGWEFIGYVRKVHNADNGCLKLERATDYGHDVLECPLPSVITVLRDIGEPRMPSLKGKMKAKKLEPTTWGLDDLQLDTSIIGLRGSPTRVSKIFTPPARAEKGEIFDGEPEEVVAQLYQKLKEYKWI